MQVSFHGEVEDHVVIGGGAAVACGIDDSAEFLDMLSDTIYREKALAAVREPICNAWDAHINSGKTDIPLVITLADGKMTIQDFGPGIAPEKMHGIYCVYGRSTKKTDEAQTGGFGIGSKAPWAYSKHFTVTSAHNGTRTIYAMSKGSTENAGKPDMRPITSVACDQSGLTVTIPIKDGDERKFDKLVRSVVIGGGIRAVLNGELLPYREYDAGRKQGFVLVEANDNFVGGKVGVLVGTVLYPLNTEDAEICKKLHSLDFVIPEGFRAVLLAGPNTISIAPSRESLSYGDRTLKAVNDLLDKSLAAFGRLRSNPNSQRRIIQMGLSAKDGSVRFKMPELFKLLSNDAWSKNVLADPASISMVLSLNEVKSKIRGDNITGKTLVRYALDHLRRTDRSRSDLWKEYLLVGPSWLVLSDLRDDIYQHTVKRIAKKAAQLGLTKEITMFHRSSFKRMDIRYSLDSNRRVLFDSFLYVANGSEKPVAIISCRAGVARDWVAEKAAVYYGGKREGIPTLIVDKNRKDEARLFGKFLTSMGFDVADLLDQEPKKNPKAPKVEKPKKTLFFAADKTLFGPVEDIQPYQGTPKHFIYISQRRAAVDVAWRATYRTCIAVAEAVPDTCVIFDAAGLKEAEAKGMTSAMPLAFDLVEKAIQNDTQAVFESLCLRSRVIRKGQSRYYDGEVIEGLNSLIERYPVVFSLLRGRRNAHVSSDQDKRIGNIMDCLYEIRSNYEAQFRGRYNDETYRLDSLSAVVRDNLAKSRICIEGSELLNKFPNLRLAKFVTSHDTKIPESTVVNIVRAFMKS